MYVYNTLWNKKIPRKESRRSCFVLLSLLMLQAAPHGSSEARAIPAAVDGFAVRTALGLSGELCPDTRGNKCTHSFAS